MDENIQALLVAAGLLYLVPAAIASMRRHPNAGAIILVNVLLGWTLLGWVVALVWSVIAFARPAAGAAAGKTCPQCAEDVKDAARVCRFCGHEFAVPAAPARKVWFHWRVP